MPSGLRYCESSCRCSSSTGWCRWQAARRTPPPSPSGHTSSSSPTAASSASTSHSSSPRRSKTGPERLHASRDDRVDRPTGAAVHARRDSGRGHRRLPAAPRVGARTHRRAARAALPGVGVLRVHRQRRRPPRREAPLRPRGASLHASSREQASSARGRRCSIQATSCCCPCVKLGGLSARSRPRLGGVGDTLLVCELDFSFSTSQLAAWAGGRTICSEAEHPRLKSTEACRQVGGRSLRLEPLPVGPEGVDAAALRALLDGSRSIRRVDTRQ